MGLVAHAVVGAGAALGALARFGVVLAALATLGPAFAWGTLAANMAGSFLICLYVGTAPAADRSQRPVHLDRFVVAGFCGGFTTFSIFSLETVFLWQEGPVLAGAYVAVSLAAWLAAGWAGFALATRLSSRAGA